MLKNYLKIVLRHIRKYKGYTFINIFGLALGMACCILILMWVYHEINFDKFHKNGDRIYRILQHIQYSEVVTWAINQGPLAPALKDEIPEIQEAVRYKNTGWRMKYNNQAFVRYGGYVDPEFLTMFDFPLIKGNPATVLSDPYSVVITEKLAETIFGNEDPIGKVITLADEYDIQVTGVLKNIRDDSHLQFDFLATMAFAKELGYTVDIWTNSTFNTYVMLSENVTQKQVEEKIYNFLDEKPTLEDWEKLTLQPLKDIHLSSGIGFENAVTMNIQYVIIFFAAALFILIIACINFVNLSTARSALRSREVGLRKVVGARRGQLIRQFFSESTTFTLIAFMITLGLIVLLLPLFNQLSEKAFTIDLILNPVILLGVLAVILLAGLLSGIYPAIVLSSYRSVDVLKGTLKAGRKGGGFRHTLVVFQFVISIFLLIGTLVIYSQIRFMQTRNIGYDKENLVQINMRGDIRQKYPAFKQELLKNPHILKVASARSQPTYGVTFSNSRWRWDGKNPEKDVLFRVTYVDEDYISTFGIELLEGRSFSREFVSDSNAIIINQTAARAMGMEHPVGQIVQYDWQDGYPFPIVGLVKDFNFMSMRTAIEPMIYLLQGGVFSSPEPNFVFVRIQPKNIRETIRDIEQTWKALEDDREFQYTFLDDAFTKLYRNEERIGHLLRVFTVLATFISCLGLFGLASFMAMRRTKEIGIRKVLGASIPSTLMLLVREFTKWIIIANCIAWPLTYFAMQKWLQSFAYRTTIHIWIFALTGFITLLIALLSVSYQTIKAARANPVESLRYE